MTYYKKRTDANQAQIIHTFIALGATVLNLSRVGEGCPDILIGYKKHSVLCEIKRNDKAPYTESQVKFMQNWRGGAISRIDSVDAAIRLIKMLDMGNG
jgi:rhamnose utilization protein RhaD (predicted bifunctional aldolase and dehydrogenase)